MNRKLKCILSAVLVFVLIMSAMLVMPATAAESDEATGEANEVQAAVSAGSEGEVFAGEQIDAVFSEETDRFNGGTEEVAEEPEAEAKTDISPVGDGDENPTEAPTDPQQAPSVGAIQWIKRVGKYTDRIVLEWNEANGATGYQVHWRDLNKSGSTFRPLSSVGGTRFTVKNLSKGDKYQFRITPYTTQDGTTYLGAAMITNASTRPNVVKKFRLTSASGKQTVMKWNKSSNVDGYVIYRQADGRWSKYQTLGKSATSFTDKNVTPGKAYFYRILAYRQDTTGSMFSPAHVQLNTVCGLSAPADRGSTSRLKRVNLSWKKNPYANAYELYYSYNNKDYKYLKTTKSTYYNSARFNNNTKIYFRIYPVRYVGKKDVKVYGTYNTISVKTKNTAYGRSFGDTYIEISISEQHLWFVYKGEVYVSTDVVTGNYHSMDTPKGYYSIRNKARGVTLSGAGYSSYVNYWMAFIGSSYGIHDSSWRSSFGGSIYKGNGSHGCVNTPYANVKKIYEKASVGTPVIIY